MSNKLTKEELKSKKEYHNKRYVYYDKKLKELEKEKRRIGFRLNYDRD